MARDIRSYDSEQDIRNAWKVCAGIRSCVGTCRLQLTMHATSNWPVVTPQWTFSCGKHKMHAGV
jgi:hypothetical protein